jgi:predicted DNA-binding protein with PD1-like motif
VLDFERNVPFQVLSNDVHAAIRLSTLFVIFGGYAFVEISKNMMEIVIFEIVKHYRKSGMKKSDSMLLI